MELPLGQPLQVLVYNVGGGTGTRKKIKAVQSGGPSGGCIPVELFNTPVDYESLNSLGAIMGSGGMVVMDQDNCMVDVARYFTEFTTSRILREMHALPRRPVPGAADPARYIRRQGNAAAAREFTGIGRDHQGYGAVRPGADRAQSDPDHAEIFQERI